MNFVIQYFIERNLPKDKVLNFIEEMKNLFFFIEKDKFVYVEEDNLDNEIEFLPYMYDKNIFYSLYKEEDPESFLSKYLNEIYTNELIGELKIWINHFFNIGNPDQIIKDLFDFESLTRSFFNNARMPVSVFIDAANTRSFFKKAFNHDAVITIEISLQEYIDIKNKKDGTLTALALKKPFLVTKEPEVQYVFKRKYYPVLDQNKNFLILELKDKLLKIPFQMIKDISYDGQFEYM